MRAFQIETLMVLVAITILGFQNCSGYNSPNSNENTQVLKREINKLSESIHNLNDELQCTQDLDCEVLGLGSQTCGGPTDFIIASTLNSKYDEILNLADKLERKERLHNALSNLVQPCVCLIFPTVQCVANTCQQVD